MKGPRGPLRGEKFLILDYSSRLAACWIRGSSVEKGTVSTLSPAAQWIRVAPTLSCLRGAEQL